MKRQTFAMWVKRVRENANMTQEELAEKLNITNAIVSVWESGKGYPSLRSIRKLSEFTGVKIETIRKKIKLDKKEEN